MWADPFSQWRGLRWERNREGPRKWVAQLVHNERSHSISWFVFTFFFFMHPSLADNLHATRTCHILPAHNSAQRLRPPMEDTYLPLIDQTHRPSPINHAHCPSIAHTAHQEWDSNSMADSQTQR